MIDQTVTDSALTDQTPRGVLPSQSSPHKTRKLHPVPIRVMHWLNAIATIILIGSGWTIYNDQPLFSWIRFPYELTMGGEPEIAYKLHGDAGFGGATAWHFAAMWLLFFNGIAYLVYGIVTHRFLSKLFPIRPRDVVHEIGKALRFDLKHDDITHYNAVQKLLYLGVIAALIVQVLAGIALWKPVQFSGLVWLMGGFQGVRLVHFLGMIAICLFLVVHVSLALLVPRTLLAIFTGGPRVPAASASTDTPRGGVAR